MPIKVLIIFQYTLGLTVGANSSFETLESMTQLGLLNALDRIEADVKARFKKMETECEPYAFVILNVIRLDG